MKLSVWGVFKVADYKSDVRIAISDPENPSIPSFVAIAKTLSIYTNITAIFNLPFLIL